MKWLSLLPKESDKNLYERVTFFSDFFKYTSKTLLNPSLSKTDSKFVQYFAEKFNKTLSLLIENSFFIFISSIYTFIPICITNILIAFLHYIIILQ